MSVTGPLGSAGAFHYQLIFENVSSLPCRLYGFPGVSFLDSGGKQIGPPAKEDTSVARESVTLGRGTDGHVALNVSDPGIPPCAGPGRVAGIRVYPPASYVAAEVRPPAAMEVCTSPNTANYIATTVGPVTASSSSG
jgi:hypothetical protein